MCLGVFFRNVKETSQASVMAKKKKEKKKNLPPADILSCLLLMILGQGIIWVWCSNVIHTEEFSLMAKKKVFPASCQIIAESHPRIFLGGRRLHVLEMCLE